MIRILERIGLSLIIFAAANVYGLVRIFSNSFIIIPVLVLFIIANILPELKNVPGMRLKVLSGGINLLVSFLISMVLGATFLIWLAVERYDSFWINLLIFVVAENIVFWNGIIRIYAVSVQLGIKWRVIGIICGPIPVVHLIVLIKLINIASSELKFEVNKILKDSERAQSRECNTKYPILLVHGVFFRDSRYLNYWGRIPKELERNGAVIFYGNQESAGSIEACGKQLAERIEGIVKTTGCGKVNIIAHSKGGLDSRYAISMCGADRYTASLTTINTPHRGCIFADYLLKKISPRICASVAKKYNSTLKKLGDSSPDFLGAVNDLTSSSCSSFNDKVKDVETVVYRSCGSFMIRAGSGKFPLNMSYPLVRHFDGQNDGLVSVASMPWGESFRVVAPEGKRGVSHGDMIDLNRENIDGFDVREFYVDILKDLKASGL